MRTLVWINVLGLVGMLAAIDARGQTPGDGLVAAWSLNGAARQVVPDVSGHAHHAAQHAAGTFVASPGRQALVFDGESDFLQVSDHAELRMTDRLTVDLWVWLDTLDQSSCLVDKGGERYRIQVAGGRVVFALKGDAARLDLNGPKLSAQTWHRITGVFQRPRATLYVDGRLAAEHAWDHEIGPGGDLYIGAQSGSLGFLKGRIDELRIYRAARPPLATDRPTSEPLARARLAVSAELRAAESPGGVRVDTGAMRFELRDEGLLRRMQVGAKALVADNAAPLLAAEVFESQDYDGWTDHAPGRTIAARWQPAGHEYRHDERQFQAAYKGRLDFGRGDALQCELTLAASAGSPFLVASARLEPQGRFENRFLRSAALRLPLALNKRKRVVQAGDRGVQWDTRHWYQFHAGTTGRLMTEPDHNLWRLFSVDQLTPGDYHIWRSESPVTCPLSMQRGVLAPGWMAVYDQQAGLLLAYRGLSARAPKSLRVNAEGPGEAAIDLWHAGLPALDLHSPEASAVFGRAHVTDWMPFAGEFPRSQPDVLLAEHWGVDGLSSDPPARNEIPQGDMAAPHVPPADADAPLATGGVPLPRGALREAGHTRLRHNGADVPLQARAIGFWPDRSIKWLLLTFPADGGAVAGAAGEGDVLGFELTRRDGSKSAYRLDYGGAARPGAPRTTLAAKQDAGRVTIDTGPLELAIAAGPRWLASAKLGGRELLAQGGARSFVDFLRTESPYPCLTTQPQGTADDGGFTADSVRLEEAGPLRAVVRLEGMTTSKEPARVIVRLEAYAGRSVARVFQSVEFLHKDPRAAFVRRMGIEIPLAAIDAPRVSVGGEQGPVGLGAGTRAGLAQHSHLGYRAWRQQAGERFLRTEQSGHRSRGWIDLGGPRGGVAMVLRDMWQQFPNELVAEEKRGLSPFSPCLTAYFWPESGPLMDMRRYSNYPHPSQGESAPPTSDWVARVFYPSGPVVGVSKTHELLLWFHGPDAGAAKVDAVAADFHRPPLVFAGGDWNVKSGVVLPQSLPSAERFGRLHANLDHYARFWMHQQKLWGWYGFWDYGDVQHNYKSGYGSIVAPERLAELVRGPVAGNEKLDVTRWLFHDYQPNNEWAFDNGRWGWNNTEGLPGLYVQNHYLRTGDRQVFFLAEAMSRHFRDVDMRHDGRWLGLGTRHGVQHWSDGNHEERQTTHSEFRYVYGLTGDGRSRDFAGQLFEKIYSQRYVGIHAAHSGRLQGLLTWWEMTGREDVGALLAKYVPHFAVEQGICESPRVQFPAVTCSEQTRDVNAGNMFFWTFGAGHGLIEYFELTGDERLKAALIRAADLAMKQPDPGNFRKAVTFAARHAADPRPYRSYLEAWARESSYAVQIVPHNPRFYGGPHGMLRGSVSGSLFVMNDMPYMLSVLPGDPPLSERQRQSLRTVDRSGGPAPMPLVLNWQADYDRPELADYLRIKHPQP